MPKPIASLSLDLDDKWAYLRAHGVAGWEAYPSYLGAVTPRVVDMLRSHGVGATVFVVGRDLGSAEGRDAVGAMADAGCEIGNHSQNHYPWLSTLDAGAIEGEVAEAEEAIELATGLRPVGFRAPGFSWSPELLDVLARRGYAYDASLLPTTLGPAMRLYSRLRLPARKADNAAPRQAFATMSDAFRSLNPHTVETASGPLVEAPVTTMPLTRAPIHATYFTFLAQLSTHAAKAYASTALRLCRLRGVAPSLLLHPLDFLGVEDEPQLAFFPGMKLPREKKHELMGWLIKTLAKSWRVGTVAEHVAEACGAAATKTLEADEKETYESPEEEPVAAFAASADR